MKSLIVLVISLSSYLAFSQEIPESLGIKGKLQFKLLDEAGKLMLEEYIGSASEVSKVSKCSIEISAYDDFYNYYHSEFSLALVNGNAFSYIEFSSWEAISL